MKLKIYLQDPDGHKVGASTITEVIDSPGAWIEIPITNNPPIWYKIRIEVVE